jgi:hypothetical protein
MDQPSDHQRGHRGPEAYVLGDGDDRADEDVETPMTMGSRGRQAHAEQEIMVAIPHPIIVPDTITTRVSSDRLRDARRQRAADHRGEHHQHVLDRRARS